MRYQLRPASIMSKTGTIQWREEQRAVDHAGPWRRPCKKGQLGPSNEKGPSFGPQECKGRRRVIRTYTLGLLFLQLESDEASILHYIFFSIYNKTNLVRIVLNPCLPISKNRCDWKETARIKVATWDIWGKIAKASCTQPSWFPKCKPQEIWNWSDLVKKIKLPPCAYSALSSVN